MKPNLAHKQLKNNQAGNQVPSQINNGTQKRRPQVAGKT